MARKIRTDTNMDMKNIFKLMFDHDKNRKKWTQKEIETIFSNKEATLSDKTKRQILFASAIFVQNGITPELYETLYKTAQTDPVVNMLPIDLILKGPDGSDDDETIDDEDYEWHRPGSLTEGVGPQLPDADKKSLLLRIQLRGVKKPPLWREVRIPASLDFESLHEVIQILFGWYNAHLWQFEKSPYSHGYRIAPLTPDSMSFGDEPTDVASETPVTCVLQKEGDKMIYLYDFGDDWVHDISVKKVIDEPTGHPVCTAWKSNNPVEDCGGVWGLMELRENPESDVDTEFDLTYVNDQLENI